MEDFAPGGPKRCENAASRMICLGVHGIPCLASLRSLTIKALHHNTHHHNHTRRIVAHIVIRTMLEGPRERVITVLLRGLD